MKKSRAWVTQLVKKKIIILKNGKVDPAQAGPAYEANIDQSRQLKSESKSKAAKNGQLSLLQNGFNTDHQSGSPGSQTNGFNTEQKNGLPLPSLTDVRRDHELRKMEKTEIEIKTKRGQLVPKGEALKMVVALGTAVKLALMNLPRRLAPSLKILSDEKEIEIFLRSEIKNVIQILEQAHAKPKRSGSKNPKGHLGKHLEAAG